MMFPFFVYCLSVPGSTPVLMEEVNIGRLTPAWVTFFGCTTRDLW
jgi:hypothetical protein